MRRLLLTERAADEVMRLRENELATLSDAKSEIADVFGILSTLINLGRDCEELQNSVDDILRVMEVVNKYNDLLNLLNSTSERIIGRYEYVESKKSFSSDRDSIPVGLDLELLRRVFDNHSIKPKVSVDVDNITMEEAAEILGISIDELNDEIQDERSKG